MLLGPLGPLGPRVPGKLTSVRTRATELEWRLQDHTILRVKSLPWPACVGATPKLAPLIPAGMEQGGAQVAALNEGCAGPGAAQPGLPWALQGLPDSALCAPHLAGGWGGGGGAGSGLLPPGRTSPMLASLKP